MGANLGGASRPGLREGDADKAPRWRRASIWIALAIQIAASSFAAAGAAASVPGQGRAWELVTPTEATSAYMSFLRGVSVSGDRAVVGVVGTVPGAGFSTLLSSALAERGTTGWALTPLEFPDPGALTNVGDGLFNGPKGFSSDLSASVWVSPLRLQPGQSERSAGLYRSLPAGEYELLADMGPGGIFSGASADLQQIVFFGTRHLLPSDAGRAEGSSIYEIDGSTLRQVDLDSNGALLSTCGSGVSAISRDVKRVFFANPSFPCPAGRIYLREGETTTEISASRCTRPDCSPEREVIFAKATPDGSVAFLRTRQQLTNDDTDEISDFYRYEVASGDLTRITSLLPSGPPGEGATGSAWPSEDGSRVYFQFEGALLPGLGSASQSLYLIDADGLHFIAESTSHLHSSEDGRFVVFDTASPLDAADTDGRYDVYRYDAENGTATRISSAGAGVGNGDFDATGVEEFGGNGISADGRRAFFTTLEQLVPEDRNEATDVYEWAGGELGLVSGGRPGYSATFLANTPDGRTVFLATAASLVPSDRDVGDMDVYAARIGGGFAETPPPAGCEGEACRAAPAARVARPLPRSAAARPPALGLVPLGRAARRKIVASGWIVLEVEAPAGGRLSARAKARIGPRLRTVAAGSTEVRRTGPLRMRLRLTRAAREELARGSNLRVRLVLRLSPAGAARVESFTLEGTP